MAEADFTVSRKDMIQLAIEHWRIVRSLDEGAPAAARHGLRKIGEFLKAQGISTQTLDGLPYDEGMSARVVDRIKGFSEEGVLVAETVLPLVLQEGRVIQAAEVVIAGA